MARKRKKEEEHENLERWLVSYADFITLLFAFFVTMYAISRVDEQKLGSAVESLQRALGSLIPVSITQRDAGAFPTKPNLGKAIVVSEETGSLSVVVDGQIERGLTPDALRVQLRSLLLQRAVRRPARAIQYS